MHLSILIWINDLDQLSARLHATLSSSGKFDADERRFERGCSSRRQTGSLVGGRLNS
jgi:hypothetical protein